MENIDEKKLKNSVFLCLSHSKMIIQSNDGLDVYFR